MVSPPANKTAGGFHSNMRMSKSQAEVGKTAE
jgi:hypothetical protein